MVTKTTATTPTSAPPYNFPAKIPGPPLQCPKCASRPRNAPKSGPSSSAPPKIKTYTSESSRNIHYLQYHILGVGEKKVSGELLMRDEGNYDGPLGKGRHVVHRGRLCAEPESWIVVDEGAQDEREGTRTMVL